MSDKPQKKVHRQKWLRPLLVYCASIIGLILLISVGYSLAYNNKIYPRVTVAGTMIGGLNESEARSKLTASLKNQKISPVILTAEGQSFTVKPEEIEASINLDSSLKKALAVGRGSDWLTNITQKITAPLFGLDLPAEVSVNKDKFNDVVTAIATKINKPEHDANLVIQDGVVTITPSAEGKAVDTNKIKQQLLSQLGRIDHSSIELQVKAKKPQIFEESLGSLKKETELLLSTPIIFTYNNQDYPATPGSIGGWIKTKTIKKAFQPELDIYFDEDEVSQYIRSIAEKIDQEPKNARVAMVNGQVNIIESSKDGLVVDVSQATTDAITLLTLRREQPSSTVIGSPSEGTISPYPTATATALPQSNQITLHVEVKKPDITDENISQTGIKERIAIATTDFKTSPANRQENIKLGTKLFNGIILKPGAQFSAIKSLGRIDESAGFKKELVIKQDQLASEVGGGLCQVSTTLFRAVMNAGLSIDERRNHRYRVAYYETRPSNPDPEDYVTLNAKTLVGMDATIYDPSPDFKFTNDTSNYILIQGHIEGTRLTFELFGTKDGRKTSIDGPYITATIPAPTDIQYIDDPTLPAGVTKIKEKPHDGAKTWFNYVVEKDGKVIHKNTFSSSYVAWTRKDYRGTGPAVSPSPSVDPNATPGQSPTVLPSVEPSPSPSPSY